MGSGDSSRFLLPDPGMIRAEEYCSLVGKSQIQGLVLNPASGLLSLHMKSVLELTRVASGNLRKVLDARASRIQEIRKYS